jgi:competence protein ComEA
MSTNRKSRLHRIAAAALAVAMALTLSAGTVFAAEAKVDINKASVEELTALPGVGETLARRIVEYREQQGPFGSPEELMNVKGIGERSFEKLRDQLTVGAAPQPSDGK